MRSGSRRSAASLLGDALGGRVPSRDNVALATRKGDEARLVPLRGAGHLEPIDPSTPELVDVSEAVRRLVYQPSRRGASGA